MPLSDWLTMAAFGSLIGWVVASRLQWKRRALAAEANKPNLFRFKCIECDNVFMTPNHSKEFYPNYCCYCGMKINRYIESEETKP